MLYASQDNQLETLHIPRNLTQLPSGSYVLEVRSNVNRTHSTPADGGAFNADFNFDFSTGAVFIDMPLYHRATFSWPETPQAGEYSYWLKKGGVIVASGLLMVTKGHNTEEYDNSVEYEQYEETNE